MSVVVDFRRPVELYTVFSDQKDILKNLAENLDKSLFKNLVNNLAKNLNKNLAEHLVPNLEEETCVVRLVFHRDGVVQVVLERRVDEGVISREHLQLVAPVQVDAVAVEEDGVHAFKIGRWRG